MRLGNRIIGVNLVGIKYVFGVKQKYLLYNVEQMLEVNSTKEVFPMSILSQVPEKMQTILQTVPDEVASQTGCVKRNRKLTGSALAQTLVFRVVRTSRGKLSATHRNRCHAWYTSQQTSSGATPDPRNG